MSYLRTLASFLFCTAFATVNSVADDWPMWRYDASRSAASSNQVPASLHLQWTREFGARKPVWDDTLNRDLMTYDRLVEPIVKDGRLFVGLNDRDQVVAIDSQTGKQLWSAFCDGPVRFPPVAYKDKVYFTSDDGHLYCVRANDGAVVWKFRGGPSGRLSLGNNRIISAWPMRGGPVIRDGHLYVTAGIWPFMGTFIYSLDADTGAVEWVNDETGAQYIRQPHSAPAFAGVAPQGALVATSDSLIVPGGRSVPAVFDRHTGKLKYFELNAGGKGTGGSFVAANEASWFVHTRVRGTREFALDTGLKTAFVPQEPVLAGDVIYSASTDDKSKPIIVAYDAKSKEPVWQIEVDAAGDLIQAGDHLIAASSAIEANGRKQSTISIIQLPIDKRPARIVASLAVPGAVERLLVADQRIYAVTLEGQLHALGDSNVDSPALIASPSTSLTPDSTAAQRCESLLANGAAEGYALWFGAEDEALVLAAASASPFVEMCVFDDDAARVDRLRRSLDAAGLYGRISVHAIGSEALITPPYVAHQTIVSPRFTASITKDPARLQRLYDSVRPYGGVVSFLTTDDAARAATQSTLNAHKLEQADVQLVTSGVKVTRVGPLPGSGSWTHQYGNIANTIKSADTRVQLPLGVLWYGGVSHEDVLPRHGHGPPEQVVGGRLFIEGVDTLTARDVYTGRVLWQREFKELGTHDVYFDDTYKETPLDPAYNQVHIPGANGRGTNYVVTEDRIYILEGATCHVLDTATGQTVTAIKLPQENSNEPNEWGYIGVYENVLIGGVGFAKYRTRHELEEDAAALTGNKAGFSAKSLDRAASMALVGFDRHTGEQLWHVKATHSFWHNGIVAGNGRVFALDRNPKQVEEFLKRRGKSNPDTYRMLCFDVNTGRQQWQLIGEVFGSWLGYSADKDLLLQAGAAASDRLVAEVGQGMAVYQGRDGTVVWKKSELKYSGPCVLHNDLIITNTNSYAESAGAFYLNDGSQKMTKNPLTGQLEPWKITRAYGCNSIIASENMLTFRSGAAGFYDLLTEAGTGNLGGFRSGCTSNLIAADGVLNAPDYTRTCSCSYQNQTSLALVHMPEIDTWSISNSANMVPRKDRIDHIGLNLSAPGDRRSTDGVMWLEYPIVSGDSPNLRVEWNPGAEPYQDHPLALPFPDGTPNWIESSGIDGVTSLRISLMAEPKPEAPVEVKKSDDDDEKKETAKKDTAKKESAKKDTSKKASDSKETTKQAADKKSDAKSESKDDGTNKAAAAAKTTSDKKAESKPEPLPPVDESRVEPLPYRVKLHFAARRSSADQQRRFDVDVAGQAKLTDVKVGGASGLSTVHVIDRVMLGYWLDLKFQAHEGQPIITGIELERLP